MLNHTELVSALNKKKLWGLKKLHIGNILWLPLWNYEKLSIKGLSDLFGNEIKFVGGVAQTAFFISNYYFSRKDHLERFKRVTTLFKDKKIIIETNKRARVKLSISLPIILVWYIQLLSLDISPKSRWIICCNLYRLSRTAKNIYKRLLEFQVKRLVVFSDAAALDNYLVQLCNMGGIYTITLQHGIINGAYDYVEYRASESKKFLAWGQYTYDMGCKLGMSPKCMEIVGNINLAAKYTKGENNKNSVFLVALGGNSNRNEWKNNYEILKLANSIAEKFSLKFIIRFHPNDNPERYNNLLFSSRILYISNKESEVCAIFQDVDFVLCGNSTVFVEGLYYKIPTFRYINKKMSETDVCMGIEWGKIDSLIAFERYYSQMGKAEYEQKMRDVVQYMFADVNCREQYYNAILSN